MTKLFVVLLFTSIQCTSFANDVITEDGLTPVDKINGLSQNFLKVTEFVVGDYDLVEVKGDSFYCPYGVNSRMENYLTTKKQEWSMFVFQRSTFHVVSKKSRATGKIIGRNGTFTHTTEFKRGSAEEVTTWDDKTNPEYSSKTESKFQLVSPKVFSYTRKHTENKVTTTSNCKYQLKTVN